MHANNSTENAANAPCAIKKKEINGVLGVESSSVTKRNWESFLLLQIHCSNPFPFQHEILYEWINVVYLDMDSQAQIQEEFEERSEILLKDFLKVSPVIPSDVACQNGSRG